MAKNINIFGTKFAFPRGLRQSPGTNAFSSCVASKLSGKKTGSRPAQRNAFREAAHACKGTKG